MEEEFIAWLRQKLPPHPRLLVGPGDDAAVLKLADNANCVVTVDLVSDGVDFDLAVDDAVRAGRKALAVNLSDLAAMAARPVAAVVALLLPRTGGGRLAADLYRGLLPLADEFELAIAGGDTNVWDGRLVVAITAIGETTPRGPLLRSGARPGDAILVTGRLGGSRLGRQFDFTPRVREALALHERYALHAGIDVSDGLELDLFRLARESGCGAVIDLAAVPVAPDAAAWAARLADGSTALDHALADGEDFELILAAPAAEAARIVAEQPVGVPLTAIGRCVPERGLWHQRPSGEVVPVAPRGWQHAVDAP